MAVHDGLSRRSPHLPVPVGNLIRLVREAESAMLLSHERSLQPGLVGAGLIVPVAGLIGS
jgi:hypothetical protein